MTSHATRRRGEGQKELGQAISLLRKRAGLTQAAIGKMAELHQTQISNIERGRVDPTWGNVRRIAAALGTSVDRLAEVAEQFKSG
jgi:transcriptional regulator with XRE-family HTH domain